MAAKTRKTQEQTVEQVSQEQAIEQATQRLIGAAEECRATEQRGSVPYAALVEAVILCRSVGMRTTLIGRTIRDHMEAIPGARVIIHTGGTRETEQRDTKGTAARYIMLARWEVNEFRKGERALSGPVTVGSRSFARPVEALRAGVASFRAVFMAFRSAVTPTTVDYDAIPSDPVESIRQTMARLTVRVKATLPDGKETKVGFKVGDNFLAYVSALVALLDLPIAERALPLKMRQTIKAQLDKSLTALPRTPAAVIQFPAARATAKAS